MDQNILTRRSLRATIFATALSLVLCLLVLAVPYQAAAQSSNDANRPAAQQPDNDRNQPAVQKPDRDDMSPTATQDRDQDRDRDRDNAASGQRSDKDTTRAEVRNFDKFLDSHPEIAEDLAKNPSLVNNQEFVNKHPDLKEFLQSHPGVREEVKENPQAFMRRERQFESHEGNEANAGITNQELKNFDKFLDSHPEIASDLQKNPSLVDDQSYVDKHPDLKEFLQSHSNVRREIKQHPGFFMQRERKFEKNEDRSKPQK
jgi:hypothetical protein